MNPFEGIDPESAAKIRQYPNKFIAFTTAATTSHMLPSMGPDMYGTCIIEMMLLFLSQDPDLINRWARDFIEEISPEWRDALMSTGMESLDRFKQSYKEIMDFATNGEGV